MEDKRVGDERSAATAADVVEGTRRLSLDTPSHHSRSRRTLANSSKASNARKNSSGPVEDLLSLNKRIERSFPLPSTEAEGNTSNFADARTKPLPSPRKSKEKPIPPPRRRTPRDVLNQNQKEQLPANPTQVADQSSGILSAKAIGIAALESTSSSKNSRRTENQSQCTKPPTPVFRSTANLNLSTSDSSTPIAKPKIPPRPRKLDITPDRADTQQGITTPNSRDKSTEDVTDGGRKHSLVETLTKRFTSLTATKPSTETSYEEEGQNSSTDKPQELFKATPVFIGKSDNSLSASAFKPRAAPESYLANSGASSRLKESNRIDISETNNVSRASRKRSPAIEHSTDSYSKREKRSIDTRKIRKSTFPPGVKGFEGPIGKGTSVAGVCPSNSASKSEMSIERAEQAVTESEINAVPLAAMESENAQCCVGDEAAEGQEIIRRNSSRSGRLDPGDASQSSGGSGQRHSSGGYSSSVPRSHSDISFRLGSGSGMGGAGDGQGGQHSRDSSIVSSHSRLSRASVGADLENFFNQMGLEMGVLEPMARLRELQNSGSTGGDRAPGGDASTFGSMSSIDSQDAASICSTYSRSEHECVGTGGLSLGASGGAEGPSLATGHQQPQTSIVERNARIIKWLCNVRKAIKGGQSKADGGGSSSTTTGKA